MTTHLIPAADLAKIREALRFLLMNVNCEECNWHDSAKKQFTEALALLDNLQEVEVVAHGTLNKFGGISQCRSSFMMEQGNKFDTTGFDIPLYALKGTK